MWIPDGMDRALLEDRERREELAREAPPTEERIRRGLDRATTASNAIIPADVEGELRDLARDMRREESEREDYFSLRLERIIARHSGIKPLRGGR